MKSTHNLLHWRFLLVVALVLNGAIIGVAPVLAAPSGTATSTVTPSDATPDIGDQIVVAINIDVSGVNAPDNRLGSFTGSLAWDPAVLDYDSNSGVQAGFTGAVNVADVAAGHIAFSGANAIGATGNTIVLTITFDVAGAGTSTLDLGYSAMAAAETFSSLLSILTVTDSQVVVVANQYTLTIAVSPVGGGTTDPAVGDHTYGAGTVVAVTAAPATGYTFTSWSGACTSSGSCSVTMDADKTVTANFAGSGPDLSLSKEDGGQPVEPADTISYSLTYHNAGGNAAGVVITDTVPANTTFNPGSSTSGWTCQPNGNAGSSCTLNLGQVADGGGGSAIFAVTVDAQLPTGVTTISNSARIGDDGSGGPDPNPGNNTASVQTTVRRDQYYLYLPWVGRKH